MPVYFVADVHLSENRPDITQAFFNFLDRELAGADALYILGDLFEFWIGDDDNSALHKEVATRLLAVSERLPVWYVHGNRDFLLGKQFAAKAGLRVLPEQAVIELFGHSVLVSHGDELCTDDRDYQRFRCWVRKPWLQRLFRLLPLGYRLKVARNMRIQSSKQQQAKAEQILDVNPQAAACALHDFGVRVMIHGHTHRPAIHANQTPRLVVGDWYTQGSVLIADKDGFSLQARRLDDWGKVLSEQFISWQSLERPER